jgi:hypothetical protein
MEFDVMPLFKYAQNETKQVSMDSQEHCLHEVSTPKNFRHDAYMLETAKLIQIFMGMTLGRAMLPGPHESSPHPSTAVRINSRAGKP